MYARLTSYVFGKKWYIVMFHQSLPTAIPADRAAALHVAAMPR